MPWAPTWSATALGLSGGAAHLAVGAAPADDVEGHVPHRVADAGAGGCLGRGAFEVAAAACGATAGGATPALHGSPSGPLPLAPHSGQSRTRSRPRRMANAPAAVARIRRQPQPHQR